jgi:hypothetical protein
MKLTTLALIMLSLTMISTRRLNDVAKDAVARKFRKVGINDPQVIQKTQTLVNDAVNTHKTGWFQNLLNKVEGVASSIMHKGFNFTRNVSSAVQNSVEKLKDKVVHKALKIKNAVSSLFDDQEKERVVKKHSKEIAQDIANFKNEVKAKESDKAETGAAQEPEAEAGAEAETDPAAETPQPASSRRRRRAY